MTYRRIKELLRDVSTFGSASYFYHRIPMSQNISPAIWPSYINAILDYVHSRKYCEALTDDLLLLTPDMKFHKGKLEDFLKTLLKNGLLSSPKKCQLFKKELQYMGNNISIKGEKVCIKPIRMRKEAIQGLKPSTTPKGCKFFVEVVNFLSTFCPELQKLLKPIYDLIRKGEVFTGGLNNSKLLMKLKDV